MIINIAAVETTIRKFVTISPGEKLLPAFRRAVDEGSIDINRFCNARSIGRNGRIVAFRLIGCKIEEQPKVGWVVVSKEDSEWF